VHAARDYFDAAKLRVWRHAAAVRYPTAQQHSSMIGSLLAHDWVAGAALGMLPPSAAPTRMHASPPMESLVETSEVERSLGTNDCPHETLAAMDAEPSGTLTPVEGTDAELEHMIDLGMLEAIVREQAVAAGDDDPEGFGEGRADGLAAAAGWGAGKQGSIGSEAVRELVEMLDAGEHRNIGPAFSTAPPQPLPSTAAGFHSRLSSTGDSVLTSYTSVPMPVPLPAGSSSAESMAASGEGKARNTMGRKEWTSDEDRTIMEEVAKHGQKWRIIAAALPGRSDDAVRNRWKRLSAEAGGDADAQLADALGLASTPEEVAAAKVTAKAAAKEAKPKPERLAWSKTEDAKIVECVQQFGLKWGRISAQLNGRTAHAIRNRFHRLQTLQAEHAAVAAAAPIGSGDGWAWNPLSAQAQ